MNSLEINALGLYEAILEQPSQYKKIIRRFVSGFDKSLDLAEFIQVFEKMALEKQKHRKVVVTVVDKSTVTDDFKKSLVGSLPSGYVYDFEICEDKGLVGGVVVRIDDLLVDGSYRKSLKRVYDRMVG